MIEKKLIQYLNHNTDIEFYMERPRTTPDEFVVIERVGGRKANHIQSASIAFQSTAKTLMKAAELDEKVRNAVESLTVHPDISSVKLSSNYNHTDTSMKEYRYQAVYEITYY